jgi:hypothetical protein
MLFLPQEFWTFEFIITYFTFQTKVIEYVQFNCILSENLDESESTHSEIVWCESEVK